MSIKLICVIKYDLSDLDNLSDSGDIRDVLVLRFEPADLVLRTRTNWFSSEYLGPVWSWFLGPDPN